MDTNCLEIVLIAVGILLLVSMFGIIILVCVDLQRLSQRRSLEDGSRTAAWGGSWNEEDRAHSEPYRDETFLGSVRRRSICFAEEARRDLLLMRDQTITAISTGRSSPSPESEGLGQTLRKLSSTLASKVMGSDDECRSSRRRVSEPVAQLLHHTI
jgi:hypothetical protein